MFSDAEKSSLKVGFKQTTRAINENSAKKVFVAADAEERFVSSVKSMCEAGGVPVECIDTMRELGKMCGIDVGASCAVLLK